MNNLQCTAAEICFYSKLFGFNQDQNEAPAPENLLLNHMKRWKQIRQK